MKELGRNSLPKSFSIKAIGVMSGSSLDGLDVCLCEFSHKSGRWNYKLLDAKTIGYTPQLKYKLSDAMFLSGRKLMELDASYGAWIGQKVKEFIKGDSRLATVIGLHGHTVFHNPPGGYSTQIGCGAHIAAAVGIPCVSQFRTADVVRKGQGAPLVPIGDELLFSKYSHCLNLGGFANISYRKDGKRVAYDICPTNLAINYLSSLMGKEYDNHGEMGRKGEVDPILLDDLNRLPFYRNTNAKSLNREWFNNEFLPLIDKDSISLEEKFRTTYEHIAMQIANCVGSYPGKSLLVTGGGAKNSFLTELICQKSDINVMVPDENLVDFKEAIVFAFLAILYLYGVPNSLSSATGASEDSIGGCLYH